MRMRFSQNVYGY